MGVILQEQTRHKEAISAFSKSLTLKPDNEDAQFNIGVILHEQGKYDEAVEAYKNALALNPNFAKTYNLVVIKKKTFTHTCGMDRSIDQRNVKHFG